MFPTMTSNGIARMQADNDDFLITAPTIAVFNRLEKPQRDAWQIKRQTLIPEDSIEKQTKVEKYHQICFNTYASKSQDCQQVV